MGRNFLAIGHNDSAIERRNERAALFNTRAGLVKRDEAARRRARMIDAVLLAVCVGAVAFVAAIIVL